MTKISITTQHEADELRQLLAEFDARDNGQFDTKPNEGDIYWAIANDDTSYRQRWTDHRIDHHRFAIGNCYRNEETCNTHGIRKFVTVPTAKMRIQRWCEANCKDKGRFIANKKQQYAGWYHDSKQWEDYTCTKFQPIGVDFFVAPDECAAFIENCGEDLKIIGGVETK